MCTAELETGVTLSRREKWERQREGRRDRDREMGWGLKEGETERN